jgi:hypothetical protein
MSNDLGSVHEILPKSGTLISMGTCIGECRKEWFMTEREHQDWSKLVAEKNFHWPRRCKACRATKRSGPRKLTLNDIHSRMKSMIEKAVDEEYEGDPDRLAQDLTDVAAQLQSFIDQGKR